MLLACVGSGRGNTSVQVREGRVRARGARKGGKIVPISSSFNACHADQNVTNAIQHVERC